MKTETVKDKESDTSIQNKRKNSYILEKLRRFTLVSTIYIGHAKRIGHIRALTGGISMYLCIPLMVLLNITFTASLFQWFIRPLLKIPRFLWKDYVILDRNRITELAWLDKFNCLFCGYANGLLNLTNKELDGIDQVKAKLNPFKIIVLSLLSIIYIPILLVDEIGIQIIYNILVSRLLGMHRVSIKQAYTVIDKNSFANHYPQPIRFLTRYNKNVMLRVAMLLEQIESSWCPLTHFERREGIVYPEHHKNFFGPDEIKKMWEVLATEGSVSDRKPT